VRHIAPLPSRACTRARAPLPAPRRVSSAAGAVLDRAREPRPVPRRAGSGRRRGRDHSEKPNPWASASCVTRRSFRRFLMYACRPPSGLRYLRVMLRLLATATPWRCYGGPLLVALGLPGADRRPGSLPPHRPAFASAYRAAGLRAGKWRIPPNFSSENCSLWAARSVGRNAVPDAR